MTRPIRILVISNYSGGINAIRPEVEIFLALQRSGFEITVMTPGAPHYAAQFAELGIEIVPYRAKNKFDLQAVRLIRSTVRRKQIDIIHAFNSKAIANASWAIWRTSVKLIGYRGYTGNIRWYDPALYLSFLNPRLDKMVCLAESVRETLVSNGMPEHKAVTIHKGHRAEWYTGIPEADLGAFQLPDGAFKIAFVANNRVHMKGVKFVIDAVGQIQHAVPVHVLMIGKGLDTSEVRAWIQASGCAERIHFTGFRTDSTSLVRACDASISASLFGEATQKAMIESMYMAKPVIMTDIPGNRGMCEDGIGGYVVPPGDAAAIAEAMTKLYQHRDRCSEMGQRAFNHIASFLSTEKTVSQYAELYRALISA